MQSTSSELKKPIIYSAGAGSGKTTKLVDHVFQVVEVFYQEHKRYPRIMVTTFTRKATQELRERLTKKAIEQGSQDLIQFTLSKNNLMISTIDGILNLFIRRYGIHLGLDSDFQFVSEREKKRETKKILKEIIESQKEFATLVEDYSLNELNECLIELERKRLLSSSEWSIYDFRLFEEQTLKEYHIKVKEPLEGVLRDLGCCSALSSSWQTLQQKFKELFVKNSWKDIYGYITETKIEKTGLSQAKSVSEDLKTRAKSIIDELRIFRSVSYDPFFWKKAEQCHRLFQRLSKEFHSKLWDYQSKTGCLTESDLGPISRYLLKEHSKFAKQFSQEWDYWLIDEFQDTSPDQVEILRELIGERSHFIVGDSQQSIYLFRGARPYVFGEKIKEIKSLGGKVKKMSRNYRSIPSLIAFINELFQKINPEQFKSMDSKEGESFDTLKNVANFYIAESEKKISNEKKLQKGEKKELKESINKEGVGEEESEQAGDDKDGESEDKKKEMEFIQREIKRLLEKFPEKKIAVLCRTNRHAEEVDRFLSQSGLVTQIFSAGVFGKRREIQDLMQIIKVLVNPHDDFSLVGVLRSPWFFVEPSILSQFAERKKSLWDEIEDKNIENIEILKSYQEKAQTMGLTETLMEIVIERGLLKSSLALDPTGQREANICKFISLLKLQDHRSDFNCLEFISNIELNNKEEDAVSSVESQRVHIMTIHKAKGLEFDYIFIPFIHEPIKKEGTKKLLIFNEDDKKYGLKVDIPIEGVSDSESSSKEHLPPIKAWCEKRFQWDLDELERLFYVAVTRAKEEVWITGIGNLDKMPNSEKNKKIKSTKDEKSILGKIVSSGFFGHLNLHENIISINGESLSDEGASLEKKTVKKIKNQIQNSQRQQRDHFTYTLFTESNAELSDSLSKPSCEKPWTNFHNREKNRNILKPIEWKWTSRLAQFQSVSDLVRQREGKEGVSQETSSRDFLSSRKISLTDKINYIEKTLKGTQIHADLEELSYQLSGGGEINSQLLRKEWVQYVWKLKDPPMEELLKNGNPEWPYLYRKDNIITEGRIDLWGDVDNVRWIVDYKTGAVHKEEGFWQMAAYAEALDSKHSVKDVRLVLLYPLTQKVYSKSWKDVVL